VEAQYWSNSKVARLGGSPAIFFLKWSFNVAYADIQTNEEWTYKVVPVHRNWQIETAGWNWAGFFVEGLETRWQRFGQFLNDL